MINNNYINNSETFEKQNVSKPIFLHFYYIYLILILLIIIGYLTISINKIKKQPDSNIKTSVLEKNSSSFPSNEPLETQENASFDNISTKVPTPTNKKIKTLSYKLPENWLKIINNDGTVEVAYDSSRYNASTSEKNIILSGKWVGTQGFDLHRLGGMKIIYISPYNGGSRHAELYKILGVTPSSNDWKDYRYFEEREYSYNGWPCLFITGVSISQYPVSWGYCPISSKEALVMASDGYDWQVIEQQISTIKIIK